MSDTQITAATSGHFTHQKTWQRNRGGQGSLQTGSTRQLAEGHRDGDGVGEAGTALRSSPDLLNLTRGVVPSQDDSLVSACIPEPC